MVISQVRSWLVKKSLLYLNCVHMALKNLLPTNKQDLSRQETFFSYERNCLGKWGVFYCFLRRWGKAFLLTEEILPYKRNTFLLSKGIFIISSFTKGIFIHIYLHSQWLWKQLARNKRYEVFFSVCCHSIIYLIKP